MDFNSLLHNPMSLLLAGGGVAALTAGWQHVKGFFSALLKILVITADYQSSAAVFVVRLLKSEFKQISIGTGTFINERKFLKDSYLYIPYQLIPKLTIFYRRGTFAWVSTWGNENIRIVSLRGFFNPVKLIQEAVKKRNDELILRDRSIRDRHWVEFVKGAEKLAGSMNFREAPKGSGDTSYGGKAIEFPNSLSSTPRTLEPHSDLDEPLLYSRAEFDIQTENAFEGLAYDDWILDQVNEAREWLLSGKWYKDRFIPWTLGWLLYGLPGSGKSSLSIATARELGIPVYNYVLSTLSNQEFMYAWGDMSTPCMVLFEDFDAIFDKRAPLTEHKLLTFDCLLNQISGTTQQDGVFLVITTNDPSKLDSALGSVDEMKSGMTSRPGRIDTYLELNACSPKAKKFIIDKILRDYSEEDRQKIVNECDDAWTVVQVQSYCIKHVQQELRRKRLGPTKEITNGPT